VADNCTVSYGPTTCCAMTWTPSPELSPSAVAACADWVDLSASCRAGQLSGGGETLGTVNCSMNAKSASDDRPISTLPFIGRTHANDAGSPEYVIWSQSVVCRGEIDRSIRCPVTCVFSSGGTKQPPQADAWRPFVTTSAARAPPTKSPGRSFT